MGKAFLNRRKLDELLKRVGWGYPQLAGKSGCSVRTVRQPSDHRYLVKTIGEFAEALGVQPSELYAEEVALNLAQLEHFLTKRQPERWNAQLESLAKRLLQRSTRERHSLETLTEIADALEVRAADLIATEPQKTRVRPSKASSQVAEHRPPSHVARPSAPEGIPTVGIVGAGFSGTVTAIRLLQLASGPLRILIFEQDEQQQFGGLAYGSASLHADHYLNIQAGRVSIYRERPQDFLKWVREDTSREMLSDLGPSAVQHHP